MLLFSETFRRIMSPGKKSMKKKGVQKAPEKNLDQAITEKTGVQRLKNTLDQKNTKQLQTAAMKSCSWTLRSKNRKNPCLRAFTFFLHCHETSSKVIGLEK